MQAVPLGVPRRTSARVLAALFDVAVGIRLLMPDDILGTSPSYRLMKVHFLGDWQLGLALLAIGLVMTVALYTDHWCRATSLITWVSFLTWVVVAVDIMLVSVSQLGTLVYGLVAILNAWAYAHHAAWNDQLRRATS